MVVLRIKAGYKIHRQLEQLAGKFYAQRPIQTRKELLLKACSPQERAETGLGPEDLLVVNTF